MIRVIQAPLKYIQGPDMLNKVGELTAHLGHKFFIISGRSVLLTKRDKIVSSFTSAGSEFVFEHCGTSVTDSEIDRLSALVRKGDFDCVIGMGGGTVIDTAKAVASRSELKYVSAPTTASSDAPCSSVSILYDDRGHVAGVDMFRENPALVIADSSVISQAPPKLLCGGMGDALATWYEANVCIENDFSSALGYGVSRAAMAIARECRDVILSNGANALALNKEKKTGAALEDVIEACFYLSGFGFENGGLSIAHAVQDALMTIPECHEASTHGERVAFGVLVLLALIDNKDDFNAVYKFNCSVGLPVKLSDIGITRDVESKMKNIVPLALSEKMPMHAPPGTNEENLFKAIMRTS